MYEGKLRFIKRVQDLEKGVHMMSRLANSAARDVVPLVLELLTVEDLVELEAVSVNYGFRPTEWLKKNQALTRQIFCYNTFEAYSLGYGADANPSLNYERLWGLSPNELLIECRTLTMGFDEGLYAVDYPVFTFNSNELPKIAFNPVHDLLALAMDGAFQVLSFAGPIRATRGQLLYHSTGSVGKVPCDTLEAISWSPDGQHLAVFCCINQQDLVSGSIKIRLDLYKFQETTLTIRKCLHAPVKLEASLHMLTSCMWTSDDSFLWPRGHELLLVTLTKRNEVITRILSPRIQDLFDHPIDFDPDFNIDYGMRTSEKGRAIAEAAAFKHPEANYGNFFATGCAASPSYYCLLKCPVHFDTHDCVAVVSKSDNRVSKIINVPGVVVEIKTAGPRVYILFSQLSTFVCEGFPEDRSRVREVELFDDCPYVIPQFKNSSDYRWTRYSSGLLTFTDRCLEPVLLSEPSLPTVDHHVRDEHDQTGVMRQRLLSNFVQAAADFVQLTIPGEPADPLLNQFVDKHCCNARIFVHHRYVEQTLEEWNEPEYYYPHPTKPLGYKHCHDAAQKKLTKIYLARNATEAEVALYPDYGNLYDLTNDRIFNEPVELACIREVESETLPDRPPSQ